MAKRHVKFGNNNKERIDSILNVQKLDNTWQQTKQKNKTVS